MERPLLITALSLLAACGPSDGDDIIIGADNATITLGLRNPTLDADPTVGIDTLQVDVLVDDQVVLTDSFAWPDGEARISGIEEYGVVRFQVSGTDGSTVHSLGRSAPVVLVPGEDLWVPITFLPVNRVFALSAAMNEKRSEHTVATLPDGHVLLAGGMDPTRRTSLDELEIYSPVTGTFAASSAYFTETVSNPAIAWTNTHDLLFVGGTHALNNNTESSDHIWLYDPVQETLDEVATLIRGRREHCAAQYITNSILVLGGPDTGTSGDILRYYPDTAAWSSTSVALHDGLSSEETQVCGVAGDGTIFVSGTAAANTGILDPFSGEGVGDAFDAITPAAAGTFVSHPLLVALDGETFWLGGGIDLARDTVTSAGQEFRLDSASFVSGTPLATPRQAAAWDTWIEEGWIVVAGGYADVAGRNPVNKVELLNPATGAKGPTVDFDRVRPGCRVSTLPDGALLITGGYDASTASDVATAAIMVPYLD
ncbi:MAG: hypothetical protein ABIO70_09105 [Pseudomonadota bacterium]